jgi:hypothetical protein
MALFDPHVIALPLTHRYIDRHAIKPSSQAERITGSTNRRCVAMKLPPMRLKQQEGK